MLLPLAFVIAIPQIRDFHWMDAEPKERVDAHWKDIKATTSQEVRNLKNISKDRRYSQLKQMGNDAKLSDQTPAEEIYFLASALIEFYPELYNTQACNDIEQSLWRNKGSDDPEFMRMAYAALCRNRAPGRWGLLGVKLRKIFPNDLQTKQSFVKDCIFGNLPLEYVYQGRTILNRDLKSGYSDYGFTDLSTNLEMSLYFKTKRKVHLDASIELLQKLIPMQKERKETTKGSEAWLKRLQTKLDNKDYID